MSVRVYTVKSHPTENKSGTVTIPTKVTVTCAHHMMQRENYFEWSMNTLQALHFLLSRVQYSLWQLRKEAASSPRTGSLRSHQPSPAHSETRNLTGRRHNHLHNKAFRDVSVLDTQFIIEQLATKEPALMLRFHPFLLMEKSFHFVHSVCGSNQHLQVLGQVGESQLNGHLGPRRGVSVGVSTCITLAVVLNQVRGGAQDVDRQLVSIAQLIIAVQ